MGGVEWWGACVALPDPCGASQQLTVDIYTDSAGLPGTLVASYSAGTANQTASGTNIGGVGSPEYQYSIAFAPLALNAGQTYWLAIGDTTTTVLQQWGWSTVPPNTLDETDGFDQYIGGSWVVGTPGFPEHNAFNLSGAESAAPEPSAFVPLAVLAGVLAAGRRLRGKVRKARPRHFPGAEATGA